MKRAVFLDRDGVINRKAPEGQYVTRWEDMEFLPGVAEAIASIRKAGSAVIVVSNQRCVAKGLITEDGLRRLHERMCAKLAGEGAIIDEVYYCPHDDRDRCECRKPAPGMLLRAAREHLVDLTKSWMIGDSDSDMKAGAAAGCRTIQIVGPGSQKASEATAIAGSLIDAVKEIQRSEPES